MNFNLIKLDTIESTNDFAKEIVSSDVLKDWTVIWAKEQTNGRGQRGHSWISKPNENLTFTLIATPNIPVEKQFYISKVVSLAIFGFLNKYTEHASIKWANDIYVGDNKIAGILIENIIQAGKINNSIIGIGININQDDFNNSLPNPISLKQIVKKEFDLESVLNEIVNEIFIMFQSINNYKLIDNMYNKNLYGLGKQLKFVDNEEKEFYAKIIGTKETGQICLQKQNEISEYFFNEIKLILE